MAHGQEASRFEAAESRDGERRVSILRGAIQPHGVLLLFAEPRLVCVRASANAEAILGIPVEVLVGSPVEALGHDAARAIRALAGGSDLARPHPLRITLAVAGAARTATAILHRAPSGGVVVELEELTGEPRAVARDLPSRLGTIVNALSAAHSHAALGDRLAREVRSLTGYDRVMIYRFDARGYAQVITDERRADLASHLHRYYPSQDVLDGAPITHLRNKLHHVVDVAQRPIPLVPRPDAAGGEGLDLTLAVLRAEAPARAQVLQGRGVSGSLAASLIHDGQLWGLLVGQHSTPKHVPYEVRAAVELLAEVASTRISALEHFAEAQAEVLVRRLEQRLIEATHTDGDWRRALLEAPRQLLQPVGATGAAVVFDGEVRGIGEVPGATDLRTLIAFLDRQAWPGIFSTPSIARLEPGLRALTPVAAGVLAVRIGGGPSEYLLWFRKEQPQDITWGGAHRPIALQGTRAQVSPGGDAWQELVHEASIPWTARELAIGKAVGQSLSDIALQVRAVRVLIAEQQLERMRAAVVGAEEPILIADEAGRILLTNDALAHLIGGPHRELGQLRDFAQQCEHPSELLAIFDRLQSERRAWRGEIRLSRGNGASVPVALRADPIAQAHGGLFGYILVLNDLTARHDADAARDRVQRAIAAAQREAEVSDASDGTASNPLLAALWANAGVAVSEIADSADPAAIAPLLREVEAATVQAARLCAMLERFTTPEPPPT